MAHQVPRPVLVQDDEDAEDSMSAAGLGKSPRALSFIDTVQSAVAQIEDRLASSPSAHPPPPSRHELPQTPPGPKDPFITRVLQTPTAAKPNSLADSVLGASVARDYVVASSGVIVSTTPPSNVNAATSAAVTSSNSSGTEDSVRPVHDAPVAGALHNALKGPAPSIAPIVKHFETPFPPVCVKDQDSGVTAAPIAPIVEQFEVPTSTPDTLDKDTTMDVISGPIAPIVEHFETSMQPLESIGSTQATTNAKAGVIVPIVEQFEASPVHDERVVPSAAVSSDANPMPIAKGFEQDDASLQTTLTAVDQDEIPRSGELPHLVPLVQQIEDAGASDGTATQTPTSTGESAQPTVDEFTPAPILDGFGCITGHLENAGESKGVVAQPELLQTEVAATIVPIVDGSEAANLDPPDETHLDDTPCLMSFSSALEHVTLSHTFDGDQTSGSVAVVEEPHESTEVSREALQTKSKRNLQQDASGATAHRLLQESHSSIGSTSPESVAVAVASVRPYEEHELQPSLDRESNIPSERDNSAVTKTATTDAVVTGSLQAGQDGTSGVPVLKSTDGSGGGKTQSTPSTHPSVNAEAAKAAGSPSGIEPDINDEYSRVFGTAPSFEVQAQGANVPLAENIPLGDSAPKLEINGVGQSSGEDTDTNVDSHDGLASDSCGAAVTDGSCVPRQLSEAAKPCPVSMQESAEQEQVKQDTKKLEDVRYEERATFLDENQPFVRKDETGSEAGATSTTDVQENTTSMTNANSIMRKSPKELGKANGHESREIMTAKAKLARDKLAKFSLDSPVRKPHRGPFIQKTNDAKTSSVSSFEGVSASPATSRSPGVSNSRRGFSVRPRRNPKSSTSPLSAGLDTSVGSPEHHRLRSPSASSIGIDTGLTGLPPRHSITPTGKTQAVGARSTIAYEATENRQKRTSQRESLSSVQIVQSSSESMPRLPRVAGLASGSGRSSKAQSTLNLRARTRIPRAATFSANVPRSKSILSSPRSGRKGGVPSSPVTPNTAETSSSTPRLPLRRALSFMPSKRSDLSPSQQSRLESFRSREADDTKGGYVLRESDRRSTISQSGSGSKPPRGGRPRFTVPEPFALTGPELQERCQRQIEETRRKAAEAEARRRIFKPRPMPDFSRPYPKPHA